MRVSKYFIPTRKEVPREAEIPSHQMMLRAGLIRQHAAGVYSILPMGWKILQNIMRIIREEMERIGCLEFQLPALSPSEIWKQSGRWDTFGEDMFRLKDRKNRDLCLAPTHEEVFTEIAANDLHSYRDMPQMWYQLQTKFRDEARPRSGLLRVRQFIMKDAYSFDSCPEGLDVSYGFQREAYLRIFQRCGLNVVVVKASSGAMGGRDCEEFMVLSESGDDQIVYCAGCGYAANQEIAEARLDKIRGDQGELRKIPTPGKRTIGEVSSYLDILPQKLIKSLVYRIEDGFAFVLVRGDHQVEERKLASALGDARPAEPEEIRALTGADAGFVSPVGIGGVVVIADPILEGGKGLVAGANENDHHYIGVDVGRDIHVNRFVSLREVLPGDACMSCGKPLQVSRAIETGHIFKLGTRYAEALGAYFLDDASEQKPIIMGSYGIGVERIMACAIETLFDTKTQSMVWPREIAPFLVEALPINVTHEETRAVAEKFYHTLNANGVSVLLDDRDERAGVKFKDADLFGSPVVVVIGERNLKEGVAEVRIRDRNVTEKIPVERLEYHIIESLERG